MQVASSELPHGGMGYQNSTYFPYNYNGIRKIGTMISTSVAGLDWEEGGGPVVIGEKASGVKPQCGLGFMVEDLG